MTPIDALVCTMLRHAVEHKHGRFGAIVLARLTTGSISAPFELENNPPRSSGEDVGASTRSLNPCCAWKHVRLRNPMSRVGAEDVLLSAGRRARSRPPSLQSHGHVHRSIRTWFVTELVHVWRQKFISALDTPAVTQTAQRIGTTDQSHSSRSRTPRSTVWKCNARRGTWSNGSDARYM